MDKQQFNNLEITEQIQYINKQLQNNSLTTVCATIGIDRATVRRRFKGRGYTLVANQYIATDTDTKKANDSNSKTVKNTNNISITIEQYNSLEKRIKDIEKKLHTLSNNNTTNTQQKQNNDKEIKFYKNVSVVRAYRVDTEIQQRFKEYCSKNNQYKISDIISTALENFLNEYDK